MKENIKLYTFFILFIIFCVIANSFFKKSRNNEIIEKTQYKGSVIHWCEYMVTPENGKWYILRYNSKTKTVYLLPENQ